MVYSLYLISKRTLQVITAQIIVIILFWRPHQKKTILNSVDLITQERVNLLNDELKS